MLHMAEPALQLPHWHSNAMHAIAIPYTSRQWLLYFWLTAGGIMANSCTAEGYKMAH